MVSVRWLKEFRAPIKPNDTQQKWYGPIPKPGQGAALVCVLVSASVQAKL